jgi:hypothetical protein
MRIHSDTLTRDDFGRALADAGLIADGVFLDGLMIHGSRSRAHGFEVRLAAMPGRDRNGKARRAPNSGTRGSLAGVKAATYDEWGYWLAELYDRDPDAIAGYYKGRDHFHRTTRDAYRIATTT